MVVIANDFQIPFHNQKALALFKVFLRREKPDWLILNGDFHDFWEISNFDLTPRTGKEFLEEIKIGQKILKSFRRILPKARITWIEGNHEFRLRRYLIHKAKELYGLPGLSVPELFGLKELNIKYIPCSQGASRFTSNFIRVGNLYVGHWPTVAKHAGYAAKGLVDDKGVSLLQGHTHRFGAHARTTVDGRVLLGIENLCMCKASYISHPNWQMGFSVVYLETKSRRFQWYPILIGDRGFVWKGREYRLAA
ncbi:metallophosphoesterase [Acidobacteria bacterium AH-259-G07]|nr:metallophosphoesterase [Acidobacteria bacterium AH-259-G07]